MGEALKDHIFFVKIILSLKYSLFKVVGQHLRDTNNLVNIGSGISMEIHGYTHTHTLCLIYADDDKINDDIVINTNVIVILTY